MALAAGTRLGTYEITGTLGAGGMGEVYRATDTKLGREVAIKTLPAALRGDPDRLARFEREARLLAALNHAHIASVYGLDEHEGTLYLAMELVEGETLERKLQEGAFPVEDALRLALQIAQALEAAHEKGVMHRDLKPANVMVTRDGVVKVLDFGLAKAFSGDPNEASAAHSPALSLAMTQAGLVLGTAGYMSPEQASGQATDQRADVWAFGVVLYEMLTGMPLFGGESVPHILADVLRTEPDWSRLPRNLHPRIKLLLERCLEKKVRNRYHSIADARVDVEKALSDPHGPAAAPEVTAGAARVTRRLAYAAAAFVVGLAAGGAATYFRPALEAPARVGRFTLEVPGGDALGVDTQSQSIAISPDGSRIVFSTAAAPNEYDWYLRSIDAVTATRLRGTERRFETPFFSWDGRWIGFNDLGAGTLKRIPVLGGPAITIAAVDGALRGASWGMSDVILYATESGLWRVAAGGGEPEELTRSQGVVRHRWPQWLPGERSALFAIQEEDSDRIALLDVESGDIRVLVIDGTAPSYTASGHIVYGVADGSLRAVPFDLETLTVAGDPVPVLEGLGLARVTRGAHYALAADGTLIHVTGVDAGGLAGALGGTLVWVDREGREEPLGMEPCLCFDFAIAPDGTRIAVQLADDSTGASNVWIWSVAQRILTRLTFGPLRQTAPIWSPDSSEIAYRQVGDGIFARRADGTGAERRLIEQDPASPYAWTVDGRLLFQHEGVAGFPDISLVSLDGESTAMPLLATSFVEVEPRLSPDGRWIAYTSQESGSFEVFVRPFPDVESGKWQVSTQFGRNPRWSADGSTLYYVSSTQLMAVPVEGDTSFRFGTAEPILERADYAATGVPFSYDVDPLGDRILVMKWASGDTGPAEAPGGSSARIVVVQNWTAELERLVPTD